MGAHEDEQKAPLNKPRRLQSLLFEELAFQPTRFTQGVTTSQTLLRASI